ncbi:MAG TPA: pyruvate ferredoxin oxidoreductase, partial [Thermodesulfobacteriota bacterium]|nr:pyruvate ferredoxin oxidoreductase [Thermodesulfobacteriota bacterium]
IADALKNTKAVCVLDRADSMSGFGGPLFNEIRSALYGIKNAPPVTGRIFGLGGRDYKMEDALAVFDGLYRMLQTGKTEKLWGYL